MGVRFVRGGRPGVWGGVVFGSRLGVEILHILQINEACDSNFRRKTISLWVYVSILSVRFYTLAQQCWDDVTFVESNHWKRRTCCNYLENIIRSNNEFLGRDMEFFLKSMSIDQLLERKTAKI